MEFFHQETNIDFMGVRKITAAFSAFLIIVSLALVITKGLNFGLDFTGGISLELRFEDKVEISHVREVLAKADIHDAKVTSYGTSSDVLIKMANKAGVSDEVLAKKVASVFAKDNAELIRAEFVGAEVGDELAEQGFLAMLVTMAAILIYVAFRFEYRFAISSVVALMHDPIVILGVFAAMQIEFDIAALAAVLAIIGYSLNDTIVVFDRVRENFRTMRKQSAEKVINISINQTLSRTIMTSFLTLLVVVALFLFGGESLYSFSSALMIGVIIGTYSSIYIAGAIALRLGVSRDDLIQKNKKKQLEVV